MLITSVLLVLPTFTSPFQTFDPEVLKSPLEDDHEGGNGPKAAPTTTTGGIKVGGTGGASVEQSSSLDSGPSSGNGANQQQGKHTLKLQLRRRVVILANEHFR